MKLWCVILDDGQPFLVEIEDSAAVGSLNNMLKEMYPNRIRCDALDLIFFLAKEGEEWLHVTPTDFKGNKIRDLSRLESMASDANLLIPLTQLDELGFPTSKGCIHILVKLPDQLMNEHSRINNASVLYWSVDCDVKNALERKGIQRKVYRLLDTNLAYYDPSADVAVRYVDTTLTAHAFFKSEDHALTFQSQLLNERITAFSPLSGLAISAIVTQVSCTATTLRRIFLTDYQPQESESPQDTLTSISASTSLIDVMTDEFRYQRIEGEHCFGPIGKAESCHIISKAHCIQYPTYHSYESHRSNRLALSRDLHGFYDGLNTDVPVMNIYCEPPSSDCQAMNNRQEVKLIVKAFDEFYGRIIASRLKEDSTISPDYRVMKTSVLVENERVFRKCIEWKSKVIDRAWEEYVSLTSAID